MNDVGVDLLQRDEWKIGGREGGLEAAAVFLDVFAGVPVGEAEIEDVIAVERADAAGTCREAVTEPGQFGKGGDLEDFDGVRRSGRPTGVARLVCRAFSRASIAGDHRGISITGGRGSFRVQKS